MSTCAAHGSGFPGRRKRASPPRHGKGAALPPPGVRENTRATVTACVENYCRRFRTLRKLPAAFSPFAFTARCPLRQRVFLRFAERAERKERQHRQLFKKIFQERYTE